MCMAIHFGDKWSMNVIYFKIVHELLDIHNYFVVMFASHVWELD